MGKKLKKVLVTLADKRYTPMVKPLENGAKKIGEWDGDFVTISSDSEFWRPLEGNPSIHFYKIFLFHEYFKQWDWVFYCDLDVMFTGKIELNLNDRDPNFIYANDDDLTFGQQFKTVPPTLRFREDEKAFQNCFNLFNSKLIDENYFEKLLKDLKLFKEYTHDLNKEQGIFNNVFFGKWRELGDKWVNRCPVLNEVDWDVTVLRNGYHDDTDYTNKTAVHFFQFFPPWDENNLRFYPLWKNNNSDGFQYDMSDGQYKYKHPNGELWTKYEIIRGQPHGEWLSYFSSGELMESKFFFDGKRVGCWKTWHENGKLWSEDNFEDSKQIGKSQRWRWDGIIQFSGHYKNNNKDGKWKFYYENGSVETTGNYIDGKRSGEWRRWLDDGQLYYVKNYKDGKLNGDYTQYNTDRDGIVGVRGSYKDDKKHGRWCEYNSEGNLTIEYQYENDVLHGDKIYYFEETEIPAKIETYENGLILKVKTLNKENGELTSEFNYLTHQRKMVEFHQDTNIKHYELNFVGDIKNGVYKRFGDDGIELVIGQYDNNKKVGEWISKFDDGSVREKENYKDGYLHGKYEKRHPNGVKWEVLNYKNGSLDGLCYTYHSNGQLISTINYEESEIIGEVKTFHPNGEKKSVGKYVDGRKDGLWKEWYANKQIKSSKTYEKNRLQGRFQEWFRGGAKRVLGVMKDGMMDDFFTFWYHNGNKQMEAKFKAGLVDGKVKIYHDNGKIKNEVEL